MCKSDLSSEIIDDYVNGESLIKLSSKYNISIATLRYGLIKSKIKVRNVKDSVKLYNEQHKPNITFSQENREIILGNLLGDGSIRKYSLYSSYQHLDKHEEYCVWLKNKLEEDGIIFSDLYKNKKNYSIISSNSNYCFNEIYDMFYVNNKRIIPPNIILTPIILRQWYISDGNAATNGGRRIARITDVPNILLDQLRSIIGVDCSYKSECFYIPKRYVEKFLNYIGEPPVDVYRYKWKSA